MYQKPFALIFIIFFISCSPEAQTIEFKVEKETFKIDETIKIEYKVNAEIDSVSEFPEGNFKITRGPNTSKSTSFKNKKRTDVYKYTIEIQPTTSGKLTVESPVFFTGKDGIKYRNIILTIKDEKLTKQELENIEFKKFKDQSVKPENTSRYILNDNFGYIEIFKNGKWEFKRKLKKREIKRLRRGI